MEDPRAAENLQVIRTLMERAALYRRALAPVSFAAGTLGLAAGALGWLADLDGARSFGCYWMLVAVGVLGVSVGIMRRQALREGEPFWSPPARRVAQAMLPALGAGLLAGALIVAPAWRDPLHAWWLPGVWMVLFGCSIHAAGFFLHRGIKLLGWVFALAGCVLLLYVNARSHAAGLPSLRLAHWVMGATFGGLHLLYAGYLAATERKLV